MCVSHTCPLHLFLTHSGHTGAHPAACTAHSTWAGMSCASSKMKTRKKSLLLRFCGTKFHTGLVLVLDNCSWRWGLRSQSLWNAGGTDVSVHSPISPASVSAVWLTPCAHPSLTFMARYVLHAPPRSVPEWAALCKCVSRLLNSQRDQVAYSSKAGSLLIFTWTMICTIDSASYPRNCLFKSGSVWVLRHKQLLPFMQD